MRGTFAQQRRIRALLREIEEVFGPALVGGNKLTSLHIELLDGAMEGYRPDKAHLMSLPMAADIHEDVKLRMDNGWLKMDKKLRMRP